MANKKTSSEFSTESLDKTTAFIEKNKKILLGIVAALIIIIGGYYGYQQLVVKPNTEKANYLLSKGQNYFNMGNFDTALNGDKAGFDGFVALAKKFSGTKAGNLANLYAGLSYAQNGDAEKAISYLEKYDTKGDALVSPAAIAALGNCYAKVGKVDKAIELLKKAAKDSDSNSLSPIFLQQAGQLLESQNKPKDALKLYQEIKEKYGRSEIGAGIDKFIERVSE